MSEPGEVEPTGADEQAEGSDHPALFGAAAFKGPVPPPGLLADYERIVPGSAERMINLAEETQRQRQTDDTKLVDARITQADNGQSFALALALICITASIVFFALGNNIAGGTLVSPTILLIVRAFLPTRR